MTIMNTDNGSIYGNLIINGIKVSESYSGSTLLQAGMTTTVVHLNAEEKVWMKSHHVNKYSAGLTSFPGHLIHAYL